MNAPTKLLRVQLTVYVVERMSFRLGMPKIEETDQETHLKQFKINKNVK